MALLGVTEELVFVMGLVDGDQPMLGETELPGAMEPMALMVEMEGMVEQSTCLH